MKPKEAATTPRPGPPPIQKKSGPEVCRVDPWGSPIDDTPMAPKKINVGSNKQPGPPKMITHAREWAVDEMTVKIYSDRVARIKYFKYEVNAYNHAKTVRVSFWDRMNGITLESKLDEAFEALRSELEAQNEVIRKRKQLEQKFNGKG